ncbi:MAG: YdcF family protein [Polyangiaceae bacterium]|nr:YdcF family protein [Polyangiaceae bacterium]
MAWTWVRGLAAFLGGFSALNLLGELFTPGFDASGWWIEPHSLLPLGRGALLLMLFVSSVVFSWLALDPRLGKRRRVVTLVWLLLLMTCALTSSVSYFQALGEHRLLAPRPIPVSLLAFAGLLFTYLRVYAADFEALRPAAHEQNEAPSSAAHQPQGALTRSLAHRLSGSLGVAAVALALALLVPVSQMVLYGKTVHRDTADAVVVFGARVYSNGKPSLALADRVRTASRLVTSGRAKWLVVSGGPGDRGTHETLAMRRLAISLGVPPERILVDRHGFTTHDTVHNSLPLLRQVGAERVLAVSHFYHLPRVKLAYQRAGVTVQTVPAVESRRLRRLPWFMVREVAALWVYYLAPLT